MPSATRPALGLIGLVAAAAAAALASLALGSLSISLSDVVGAFVEYDDSDGQAIVRDVRGPRTLVAIAVGGSLGAAGALIQGVTRNPLADPGILGIEAGAALAVVLAIFLLGIGSPAGFVWFAFAGAAGAGFLVYSLGAAAGGAKAAPINLAIAGAAVGALCVALTSAVIVVDAQTLDQFRFWVAGSVAGRELGVLGITLPFLLLGLIAALLAGRALNALALGEDVARSLGQRIGLIRALVVAAFVLLAGGAVAVAGPIGFVGLVVPHVARALVGTDYRWIVPYSILLGAILVLGADVVGRLVARPDEIQVGIMMAAIGVPVFVGLVRRRSLAEL